MIEVNDILGQNILNVMEREDGVEKQVVRAWAGELDGIWG